MLRNAMLLYPYIKNDTISHGKAAEMLGIPKMELIELYGSLGIAYPDDTGGNYCRHKKKGLKELGRCFRNVNAARWHLRFAKRIKHLENFHCNNQMKILIKSYDLCIIIVQEGM